MNLVLHGTRRLQYVPCSQYTKVMKGSTVLKDFREKLEACQIYFEKEKEARLTKANNQPSLKADVSSAGPNDVLPAQYPKCEKASILVPFVVIDDELHLLFTARSRGLSNYPSEVSFPGGKWEEGDSNPIDTALREAKEEIGLSPENVTIIGCLEEVCILSRERKDGGLRPYSLSFVIGIVNERLTLTPNTDEVEEVIMFPLKTLFSNPHELIYPHPNYGKVKVLLLSGGVEGRMRMVYGFTAWIAGLFSIIFDLIPVNCHRKLFESFEANRNTVVLKSLGFRILIDFAMRVSNQRHKMSLSFNKL